MACDQGSLVSVCTQDYKSLCKGVTILCASLVYPKLDFYILTHVTLKCRSNQNSICRLAHTCQVHIQVCRENTRISIFYNDIKPIK